MGDRILVYLIEDSRLCFLPVGEAARMNAASGGEMPEAAGTAVHPRVRNGVGARCLSRLQT
jgi:hypothetical protein